MKGLLYNTGVHTMKTFKDSRSEGSRYSKERSFGGGSGGRSMMHPATCSTCGASCEVPFRPTGSKPVLCKGCFNKGGEPRSSQRSRDFGASDSQPTESFSGSKRQLDSIEAKLDKIIRLLED